jgi:probable phosphoglycerate mutase
MPTIYLIRHGENDYVKKGKLAGRLPGVHLNEKGLAQAEALAEQLKEAPIKAIYSSPLERTQETAKPLARVLGLPVVARPGLNEVDFGTWQDKTLKQLRRRKLWPLIQHSPSRARFPEGESFAEAQLRIASELEALNHQHRPKDLIVVFSHSDMIKLAVAYFTGVSLDLFQRLMIFPASITTLHLGSGGAYLINMNTTAAPLIPPQSSSPSEKKHGS